MSGRPKPFATCFESGSTATSTPMTPRVILPLRSCGSRSRMRVDRHREADADVRRPRGVGVDRGVHADDFAADVQQRPARVAGIDRRVGLQHVLPPAVDAAERPLSAEMTPTVTVWLRLNGLPIAMTQSPGCICAESPNFASCSGVAGHLGQLNQRAVGQRVAADDLRRVALRPAAAEELTSILPRPRRRGCW